jgi:hypothetical protein
MSFQSRRLRVQLPCGEGTVLEQAAVDCPFGTRCDGASFFCDPNTCVFGEHSRVGPGGVCDAGTCNWFDTGLPADEAGRVVVDAEHLPLVRQALERQLAEIDSAEQALKARGSDA